MRQWEDPLACNGCKRKLTPADINQWPEPIEKCWERTGQCDMCQFYMFTDPNYGTRR